jgi:hypothetical protein
MSMARRWTLVLTRGVAVAILLAVLFLSAPRTQSGNPGCCPVGPALVVGSPTESERGGPYGELEAYGQRTPGERLPGVRSGVRHSSNLSAYGRVD